MLCLRLIPPSILELPALNWVVVVVLFGLGLDEAVCFLRELASD